jgi:hypothetical protein
MNEPRFKTHYLWLRVRVWRNQRVVGWLTQIICPTNTRGALYRNTLNIAKVDCKHCLRKMRQYPVLARRLKGLV